jgi:adenosylmethionine-8-amino-7-oxononanoate aminotransferase
MSTVVPVNANFAAYALENVRVVHHVGSKEQVKRIQKDADRNLRRAQNVGEVEEPGLIPPANISVDVMISDRPPQQQTTFQHVSAAYRELDE